MQGLWRYKAGLCQLDSRATQSMEASILEEWVQLQVDKDEGIVLTAVALKPIQIKMYFGNLDIGNVLEKKRS